MYLGRLITTLVPELEARGANGLMRDQYIVADTCFSGEIRRIEVVIGRSERIVWVIAFFVGAMYNKG